MHIAWLLAGGILCENSRDAWVSAKQGSRSLQTFHTNYSQFAYNRTACK